MKNEDFELIMNIVEGFTHDAETMESEKDRKIIDDRIIMILTNLAYTLHNNND